MRIRLAIVVALVGCEGGISGEDPHARATCDDTLADGRHVGEVCELACTQLPTSGFGDACTATVVVLGETRPHECQATYEFQGEVRGCCLIDISFVGSEEPVAYFAECE